MGMTQEELVVRLGLDLSQLKKGKKKAEDELSEFGKKATQSLKGIATSNIMGLWMQAVGSFKDAWDKATVWAADKFYANNAAAFERLQKLISSRNTELRNVLNERDASQSGLDKSIDSAAYKRMTDEEKYAFHAKRRVEFSRQEKLLREQLSRSGGSGEQSEIIQSKINRLGIEQVDNQEKLTDAHDKMLETARKTREEKEKQVKTERDHYAVLVKSAHAAATTASANYARGIASPLEFSIGDLAKDNTGWGRRARESMQNLEWAQWNVRHGNFALAGEQKRKADDIIAGIKRENPFLQDPLGDLKAEAEMQNKNLQTIIKDGLQIKAGA